MRGNRRHDQSISLPLFYKALYVDQTCFVRLVVSYGKIKQRFAQNAAHSCFERLVGNRVFEIIHVAVGRCAAANHFGQSEPRSHAHKILGDIFGFGRKDVSGKPLLKVEIVGDPPKQSHRHVRVPVDETRNQHFAGRINNFARRILSLDIGSASDVDDTAFLNRNTTVVYDTARAIHRDYCAALDNYVAGGFSSLGHRVEWCHGNQQSKNNKISFHWMVAVSESGVIVTGTIASFLSKAQPQAIRLIPLAYARVSDTRFHRADLLRKRASKAFGNKSRISTSSR